MSEYLCTESGAEGVIRAQILLTIDLTVENYWTLINAVRKGVENPLEKLITRTNHVLDKPESWIDECVWCATVLEQDHGSRVKNHFTHAETKDEPDNPCPRCGRQLSDDGKGNGVCTYCHGTDEE